MEGGEEWGGAGVLKNLGRKNMHFPDYNQIVGYGSTFILGAGFAKDFNNSKLPLVNDYLKTARENGFFKPDAEHKELAEFIKKYFWKL